MVSWQDRMAQASEEAAHAAREAALAEAQVEIDSLKKQLQEQQAEHQQTVEKIEQDYHQQWSVALETLRDLNQQHGELLRLSERESLDLALHCAAIILQHEVRTDDEWCLDVIRSLLEETTSQDEL